jgi:phosphomannomutase / phosphoglucomutase
MNKSAVKAYDVRGRLPVEINAPFAYRFAQACAAQFRPGLVVIGHDMRQDSPALSQALAQGFMDSGVTILPLGLCGTEEVYFNTDFRNADLGLMVTASHNPKDYNGIKMILKQARAVTRDNGLSAVEALVYGAEAFATVGTFEARGALLPQPSKDAYVERLLRQVAGVALKPLKVVCHAGNGCAGPIVDLIEKHLPIRFVKVDHEPDPRLPNGVPNPLLPEKRIRARQAVIDSGADLGLAWDGDFDRCFFYDHEGTFIEGYYIVGLIAQTMLRLQPGGTILYDPRLTWNTEDIVAGAGGQAVICKTGHAFFKQAMRENDAVYGGEMSAHHYFRDFSSCDTGMLPWLTILAELSLSGATLKQLVDERVAKFPCSGEINFEVADACRARDKVRDHFAPAVIGTAEIDGLSMAFDDWRFNLRSSNTEPLLRLNIESRGVPKLVAQKLEEISGLIRNV